MIEQGNREVKYANKNELIDEIIRKYHPEWIDPAEENEDNNNSSSGGQNHVKAEKSAENEKAEINDDEIQQKAEEQDKSTSIKIEPPSRKEGEQDRQT
jgi:hypothetical protein